MPKDRREYYQVIDYNKLSTSQLLLEWETQLRLLKEYDLHSIKRKRIASLAMIFVQLHSVAKELDNRSL